LYPEDVFAWLNKLPVQILTTSGIRVFHDYIFDEEHRARDPRSLIELELEHSRKQPYQLLGRYIHVLARKT
jgi:S-adenosylmethionine-dependent methyltransferase